MKPQRKLAALCYDDITPGTRFITGVNKRNLLDFANTHGYCFPRDTARVLDGERWQVWVQILATKRGRCIVRATYAAPGETIAPLANGIGYRRTAE